MACRATVLWERGEGVWEPVLWPVYAQAPSARAAHLQLPLVLPPSPHLPASCLLPQLLQAPGMDPFRPDQRTPVPNFFLAGSYTKQDYIDRWLMAEGC